MPKQSRDISKSTRMHHVWSVVSQQGRCTPDMVVKAVGQRLQIESDDQNFRRNIYRDLKSLADSGELNVDYLSPDGTKLTPDESENSKNLRAEYFVPGEKGEVHGGELIKATGGIFLPPSTKIMNWSIHNISGARLENCYAFHFEFTKGQVLSLCIDAEEAPLRLLIARKPDQLDLLPPVHLRESIFGLRTAILLVNEKSVSRLGKTAAEGHAVIDVRGSIVRLQNLSSKAEVAWAPSQAGDLKMLIDIAKNEMTVPQERDPFSEERDWHPVKSEGLQIGIPSFFRLGNLKGLITNQTA